ncbi:MAG: hypothetical protein JW900_04475 [Anaerolineae bacterium]|nr:hypothetical protein [Anaerolineae bacterium]
MARLVDIAKEMDRAARVRGWSRRELGRGLALYLTCVGRQMALYLSRPATLPSEQEVEICRKAFGVPDYAERRDNDHSVTLRWPA